MNPSCFISFDQYLFAKMINAHRCICFKLALIVSKHFSQTHAHYPCVFVREETKYLSNSFHVQPTSPHTHMQWQTHNSECYHTLSSILADMSLRFVAWPHIWAACLLKLHICLLIHSAAIQSSPQHNTQQKLIIKACCCTFTL